jgi:hypothetical protein
MYNFIFLHSHIYIQQIEPFKPSTHIMIQTTEKAPSSSSFMLAQNPRGKEFEALN